jgi:hypothetical protein
VAVILKQFRIVERHPFEVFGSQVEVFRAENGFLYVPLTTLCEIMNLDSQQQSKRLQSCATFEEGFITGTAADGQNIELLRFDLMALWLLFLDLRELDEDCRSEVGAFQQGAALLLHEAFFDGRLSNMSLIATSLQRDLPLVKIYKETLALATIVYGRLLAQIAEDGRA